MKTNLETGRARFPYGAVGLLLLGLCCSAVSGCEKSTPSGGDQSGNLGGQGSGGEISEGGSGAEGSGGSKGPIIERGIRRSERGTGCVAQNDCSLSQSCVRGRCQPAQFAVEPTGKECFRVDCAKTSDCCRGAGSEEPLDKCRSRAAMCSSTLPGCVETQCDGSSDCAGGGVCVGSCSVTAGECRGAADCVQNLCADGHCTIDFADCGSDADCLANNCVGGQCACDNPSYEPAAPICSDEECEDACIYACENSRCVIPTDCESSNECFGTTSLCDEGKCVECTNTNDCTFGEVCRQGRCETPCSSDLHCPLFEACEAGECIYVGCRSDRECTLLPSLSEAGIAEVDQRLLRCTTINGVGRCILPCTSDGQCPPTEVCEKGVCQYIGCETASECKAILGAFNEQSDESRPWVSELECRAPD